MGDGICVSGPAAPSGPGRHQDGGTRMKQDLAADAPGEYTVEPPAGMGAHGDEVGAAPGGLVEDDAGRGTVADDSGDLATVDA